MERQARDRGNCFLEIGIGQDEFGDQEAGMAVHGRYAQMARHGERGPEVSLSLLNLTFQTESQSIIYW